MLYTIVMYYCIVTCAHTGTEEPGYDMNNRSYFTKVAGLKTNATVFVHIYGHDHNGLV